MKLTLFPFLSGSYTCVVYYCLGLEKLQHYYIYMLFQDSTFEFERKRNRPERYDRNLAENVLKAIPKIDKIRVAREEKHHKNRLFFDSIFLFQSENFISTWCFLFALRWHFVKSLIGWKARNRSCIWRQLGSWNRASVWSKLHLCFKRTLFSLYPRSKLGFPNNNNQRRIIPWKSDVMSMLHFQPQFCDFVLHRWIRCPNYKLVHCWSDMWMMRFWNKSFGRWKYVSDIVFGHNNSPVRQWTII